ncbi:hypothetical protein AC579_8716 [Pseudocercospora musae]|uniref:Uncharacterized protein n=1 Tax=Pseudocercospora musae TaxID=113226 RepID=A0A139IW22_9PEZI|nr:hypothetical protein AC579_8716 [Pseudocercospora musae]
MRQAVMITSHARRYYGRASKRLPRIPKHQLSTSAEERLANSHSLFRMRMKDSTGGGQPVCGGIIAWKEEKSWNGHSQNEWRREGRPVTAWTVAFEVPNEDGNNNGTTGELTQAASKALSVKYGNPNGPADQNEIPDELETKRTTIKTVEDSDGLIMLEVGRLGRHCQRHGAPTHDILPYIVPFEVP